MKASFIQFFLTFFFQFSLLSCVLLTVQEVVPAGQVLQHDGHY